MLKRKGSDQTGTGLMTNHRRKFNFNPKPKCVISSWSRSTWPTLSFAVALAAKRRQTFRRLFLCQQTTSGAEGETPGRGREVGTTARGSFQPAGTEQRHPVSPFPISLLPPQPHRAPPPTLPIPAAAANRQGRVHVMSQCSRILCEPIKGCY